MNHVISIASIASAIPAAARALRSQTVAASNCALFLEELRARAIDYRRPLALLGIRDPREEGRAQLLSLEQFAAFLALAKELTGDPAIGLAAGARIRIADLGIFGLLLRSAANGEAARAYYDAYRGVIRHAPQVDLSVFESVIVCRRGTPGLAPSRVLSEYFAASTLSILRQLLGEVEPVEVRFMHSEPPSLSEHARLFGSRIRFGEYEDAVVLSSELLSRAMRHRDPVAAEILEHHMTKRPEVTQPHAQALVPRTRQLIAEGLASGRTNMVAVAELLNLNERTLRRGLEDLGTNFQTLLDEVRRDYALQHMHEGRYTTLQLSSRLGFNGAASFYRAFRRWTGSSWSEYRQRHAARASLVPASEERPPAAQGDERPGPTPSSRGTNAEEPSKLAEARL